MARDKSLQRKTQGAGDGPRRRLQPPGAADGEPAERNREEVVGGGRGGTAGGAPASAASEKQDAERSAFLEAAEGSPVGGGAFSNTPPPKPTLGGEDYLTVSFYLEHQAFPELAQRLDRAQQAAKQDPLSSMLQLGDVQACVWPGGARLGGREKGSYCRWVLKTEHGLTLLLVDRAEPHKTQPSLQVRATSNTLMRLGFARTWDLMLYTVDGLEARVLRNRISRVDAAVDLAGTPIDTFDEPFRRGHYVTRGRSKASYAKAVPLEEYHTGRAPTGFSVGQSPLLLRVYDKRRESARDPLKLELLTVARWGGLPEHATRVEVQLLRERLKQMGIDTVEDWIEKRAAAVTYVVEDWFRLTDGPVDRKHAARAPTYPMWVAVQDLFRKVYGAALTLDDALLPSVAIDPQMMLASVVGLLKSLLAVTDDRVADNEAFVRVATELIKQAIAGRDMSAEVLKRAVERGLRGLDLG